MTLKLRIREEGKGKASYETFKTLAEAKKAVQAHWVGYYDTDTAFHTDYATFELIGFKMSDIGRLEFSDWGPEFSFEPKIVEPIETWDEFQTNQHGYLPLVAPYRWEFGIVRGCDQCVPF